MTSQPSVLLVTSQGAPSDGVTPVLAALEAAELKVRAIDVGRAGSRTESMFDKVMQAVSGELAERRLLRELDNNPPDVTVAFDPATTTALGLVRDEIGRAVPVVAVIGEMAPDRAWSATDADRYLTLDDEAAVALSELGIDGERIVPVGPLCERAYASVAAEGIGDLRKRYRITNSGPVVLIEVAGLGYEQTGQLALQLSLLAREATYLFDAQNDADAATALRRQVPTLDIRAKLFGATADAARLWRCADVIVARPRPRSVARAMVLGAHMVALMPDDGEGKVLAQGLEARGLGMTAGSALLLSSALEPLLGKKRRSDSMVGADGAANIADIAWIVGNEHDRVVAERRSESALNTRERVRAAASAVDAAARSAAVAGDLEDLGSSASASAAGAASSAPDLREISALRTETNKRLAQVGKTVSEARRAADLAEQRRVAAKDRGDQAAARQAERRVDAERARMHAALAEMAQLQGDLDRLEKAEKTARAIPKEPTQRKSRTSGTQASSGQRRRGGQSDVDDLLAEMKRKEGATASSSRPSSAGSRPSSSRTASSRASGRTSGRSSRVDEVPLPPTIDDELAALKRKMKNKKR